MRTLTHLSRTFQASQLSVQALTRFCSVYVFLLASWFDTEHLALVAFQGTLLAVPYVLMESLIGKPISAGIVPTNWNTTAWARTATAAVMPVVALLAYVASVLALPDVTPGVRALAILPVVLQMPIEALFWTTARAHSSQRANLLPQMTAAGTVVGATLLAATDTTILFAAIPAQVAVLAWFVVRPSTGDIGVRPSIRESLRPGSTYCFVAGVDLTYVVTLMSVAGALLGPSALVVLRALDLAFGPFHVALSATTREDIVAGRPAPLRSATRVLTAAVLGVVSLVLIGSARVRDFIADDLAAIAPAVIGMYCLYKALMMLSTWFSVTHMIGARPARFLKSALIARVVSFGAVGLSVLWVTDFTRLVVQLVACEIFMVAWFAYRCLPVRQDGMAT
jgi:hypothetical protein